MLNSIKLTKIVRQHIKNTTFQKKRDINVTSQNTLSLLSLWPVTAAHLCRPLPIPLAAIHHCQITAAPYLSPITVVAVAFKK